MNERKIVPMWQYALRGLARTFFPVRIPDPDLAGLSPRYCYSVWLRHLSMAWRHGLETAPKYVVELGPGASQGIGLAAALSGADVYRSIDVVDNGIQCRNAEMIEPMIELFRNRAEIPGAEEFPGLFPPLDCYKFPSHILGDRILEAALAPRRLDNLRAACRDPSAHDRGIVIRHHVTRDAGVSCLSAECADMIVSQSVLIYMPDLDGQYRSMSRILKPGGYMTHQNDYSIELSFSDTEYWNSHWGCSDPMWSLLKWRQLFVINRQPHSVHIDMMKKNGFEILHEVKSEHRGIPREKLASRFCRLSDADLSTRAAFIIAKKSST